ncbi:MAG: hypothetical protein V5A15_01365 [Haloarcula sp.]|jgi:hypothetical protein
MRRTSPVEETAGTGRPTLGPDYPWMDGWADYVDCPPWVEAAPFLSAREYASLSHRTFERVHGA